MSRQCLLASIVSLLAVMAGSAPAAWLPPEPVTESGVMSETGLNHAPLVYDRHGGLHVAWAEQDSPGLNYQIYMRHRAWATWTEAELIVPYPDPFPGPDLGAKYPSLAVAGDSLFMVWHDYRHAGIWNAEIYFRSGDLEGQWGDELRLTTTANSTNPGDNGLVPTIVTADGVPHVLWYDYRWEPETADIFHAYRPAGGWVTALGDSSDVNVSQGVTEGRDSGPPAVAAAPDGVVHAVWDDHRGGEDRIRYARFVPGSGWGSPETIAAPGVPVEAPTVALAPDGRLHVVWVASIAAGKALVTRTREPAGDWGSPIELSDPGWLAGDPCMIAESTGDLHLVWQDAREGLLNREIFYRRRDAGGTWDVSGAADVCLSEAGGRSDRPSIVADDRGNLAVLWRDQRTFPAELWLREFRPTGPIAVELEFMQPVAPVLRVIGPNPFRHSVRIDVGSNEMIRVVSPTGRLVTELPAGARTWDGRVESGARASAGVYWLVDPASGQRARVVLLP